MLICGGAKNEVLFVEGDAELGSIAEAERLGRRPPHAYPRSRSISGARAIDVMTMRNIAGCPIAVSRECL